jgi:hypothetical protein
MARLDVNKVYSRFNTVINKNQTGGYFDTDRFNLAAEEVLNEIIEEALRVYSDSQTILDALTYIMTSSDELVDSSGKIAKPSDYKRVRSISALYPISAKKNKRVVFDVIDVSQYDTLMTTSAFEPTRKYPVAVLETSNVQLYPDDAFAQVRLDYFSQPLKPFWNYTVSSSRKIYAATDGSETNPNTGVTAGDSTDFDLPEEYLWIVVKRMANKLGYSIKDQYLTMYNNDQNRPSVQNS